MWDGFGSFFDLNLCVVVNAPYHTFKVWGKFTASHFRQSVGQMIDRKNRFCLKSLSSPVVFVVVVVVVARRHRRRALVELMLLFLVEWKHHGRWLWVFLQPWIFVWLWTLPIILSKYGENSEPHIFVKVMDRQWTEKIASVSSRRRRPLRCCHRRCHHRRHKSRRPSSRRRCHRCCHRCRSSSLLLSSPIVPSRRAVITVSGGEEVRKCDI